MREFRNRLEDPTTGKPADMTGQLDQALASYEVEVPKSVLGLLQLEDPEEADDIAVFVILNVEEKMLTANLRAPVVVNVQARRAYQLILDDPNIPLQQEISPA